MGQPEDRPVFGCGQETQCGCSAAKTLRTPSHRGARCETRGKGRTTAPETGRLELVKLDGSGGVEVFFVVLLACSRPKWDNPGLPEKRLSTMDEGSVAVLR